MHPVNSHGCSSCGQVIAGVRLSKYYENLRMPRHILSIGLIPDICPDCYITAGDPDSFGGKEVTLIFDEDSAEIVCIENDEKIDSGNFFTPDDPMYGRIAKQALEPLLGCAHGISSQNIADAWIYFMEDSEEIPPNIELVSEEDGGGEFMNSDGMYSGKPYIRYQLEEDDEYSKEQIIVLHR